MTKREAGRTTDTRESFVTLNFLEFVLFVDVEERWKERSRYYSVVPPHKVEVRRPGRRVWHINLTSLTANELRAMRTFWDRAFAMAEPLCEQLDKRAQEQFESGEGDAVRLYRPDPKVYVREFTEKGKQYVPLESDLAPLETTVPMLESKEKSIEE